MTLKDIRKMREDIIVEVDNKYKKVDNKKEEIDKLYESQLLETKKKIEVLENE